MKSIYTAALVSEVVLVALAVALVGGRFGATGGAAVATGAVLMGVVAVPSLVALLWSRSRAHAQFMTTFGLVTLAKMGWIGLALLYVYKRTELATLPFVLGLGVGWVVSFALSALVLLKTVPRPSADGATGSTSPSEPEVAE